jgi:hypothetical protein
MTNEQSVDSVIMRLRPRDLGGIIDQAFRLYRRHFWTFIALVAVVYVPLQIVLQLLTLALVGPTNRRVSPFGSDFGDTTFPYSSTETSMLAVVGSGLALLIFVLEILAQLFIQGSVTAAVADSHLDRPVSFSRAYSQAFARAGSLLGYIGLQLLIILGIMLPSIVPFLLIFTMADSTSASGVLPVTCALCLLFPVSLGFLIYIFVRQSAGVPAIVIEKLGPVEAFRRSWRLLQNFWWRTFAIVLLLAVIEFVISIGPALLISFLALAVLPSDPALAQVLNTAVNTIITVLYLPLQLIAMTLYYFDIRVRKEGFDLDAAMRQAYQYGYAGYGYGYGQPPGYAPAAGYGSYGQPAPQQYGQYPQPQPQGQPNPVHPPVLGYEQPSQQPQQGQYPYGYPGYPPAPGQPPGQPPGQYPGYPPAQGGGTPQYPPQPGYSQPAQPQETVRFAPPQPQEAPRMDAQPPPQTPSQETGTFTPSSAGSDPAGPSQYGNDPLGLYPATSEPQAPGETGRFSPTLSPDEGSAPDSPDSAPEKREPEI